MHGDPPPCRREEVRNGQEQKQIGLLHVLFICLTKNQILSLVISMALGILSLFIVFLHLQMCVPKHSEESHYNAGKDAGIYVVTEKQKPKRENDAQLEVAQHVVRHGRSLPYHQENGDVYKKSQETRKNDHYDSGPAWRVILVVKIVGEVGNGYQH
ncbi:hypothetical protein, conserved [Leishmania tarentolae]|uniref:Uncharacterized protein n=1 Tax=Leishmania tarentolae TaxID=5689 RepID=A0A640KG30_LEITA|nr:hypothetical protein, conserved [Leishmania tarentolae]